MTRVPSAPDLEADDRDRAISRYGDCMAARKITITIAGELADAIAAAARDEGVPVSRVYAEAAARELRLRAGRALIAQWQA